MKKASAIFLFLSLITLIACNKTEHDDEEFLKGSFTFQKGMRFTTIERPNTPIDSIYFAEEKTVEGDIVINHTQNICTYIIRDLGVKLDDKTTMNHLFIKVEGDRITWMRSKDLLAGFLGSYRGIEGDDKNRSINFVDPETEDSFMSFGVGYSGDTSTIRLTGLLTARAIP